MFFSYRIFMCSREPDHLDRLVPTSARLEHGAREIFRFILGGGKFVNWKLLAFSARNLMNV